jgi:Fe-S-cluster-containing hydrogenase component 2
MSPEPGLRERRNIVKFITVNIDRCTGCRLCELACSLKNSGECNPATAMIQVVGFDELFSVPMMCLQCEKPYCANVCPTGAIVRDSTTGTVVVLKQKCIGCKLCTMACPFGNISFSGVKRVAVKCDLCGGEPQCVTFCPTKALEFKEADTAMTNKKSTLSQKLRKAYEEMRQP